MTIESITSDFIESENSLPCYITINQFAQTTVKSLRNRFPNSALYYSIRILNPNEAPNNHNRLNTYGKNEIKTLVEFYEKVKRNKSNIIFHDQFTNLTKLGELALVIPLSNDVIEFVFSYQNLIKTKLCNKISIQTLNYHLLLSLNGPKDFSNYDYTKAYDFWNGVHRFNQ
ncbi:hypothetical protein C1645_813706 [Glomus cerebriforme]|uniref:Uncharacterized protein n=1 Tax=Glomus cerebriforme TaxID=658196 RepID=A0A397THF2_9GLOM|nr:hypothetical protein C1645_813706 [Glomus cerebriforme]